MRLSRYFLPLLKENPSEAQIASHRYMLRAGMIKQETAGIYSWLPLGMTVLEHVERIVTEELDKAGCVRLLMPTLQSTELWKESGRYDALGKEMLRFNDRADRELLYSPTCEEMIVNIFRSFVHSYKQLPLNLYQIHWKFRDEIRPRFGVMRGREFLMKDGYSFHLSIEDATREYAVMYDAYHRIFKRLGLTAIAVAADSGAIGGSLSHEFQVLAETGESQVYYDPAFDEVRSGKKQLSGEEMRALYAAADELHNPATCPLPADQLRTARGIEVGHIFLLGSKYTDAMQVNVMDASGKPVRVQMGTYGIGVSRLVGAIIEASHDEAGIIWPESVAPFQVGIVNLKTGDAGCDALAETLEASLEAQGVTVLYDDTDQRGGGKFASMDLIGLPWQIVVGPRGAAENKVEIKCRKTGDKIELAHDDAIALIVGKIKAALAIA
jgi:prolyl-tRNA synthetase